MYADGLLGNKGVFNALSPITAAVFNYFRSVNSPAIGANDVFPWIHEYSVDPDLDLTEKEKVNNSLLAFMSQAQGFNKELFEK